MTMSTPVHLATLMIASVLAWTTPAFADSPTGLATATTEATPADLRQAPPDGFIREWTIQSALLGTNRLAGTGRVAVAVHATRGWQTCRVAGSPCRILLFLPGFDGSPQTSYLGPMFGLRAAVDQQVARDALPPLVVVIVDPRTALGGSFYTDSPISGHWASFLTQELLPEVERGLQIADGPKRRWVAGHSMGGFGALHLSLLAPKAWQGALAISPVAGTAFAQGARLKAALAGARMDPNRVDALVAKPTTQAFSERLFWSMAAAWTSPGRADQWRQALDLDQAGKITAEAWQDWQKFDPAERVARDPEVCKVRRLVLTVGRKDPIIAVGEVRAVSEALVHRCKVVGQLAVVIHDGNHGNRVQRDLIEGLRELGRGN
jgi:S-formylglutathione hydrolase FrmB